MTHKVGWTELLDNLPMAILIAAAAPVLILLNLVQRAVHVFTNPRENESETILRREIEDIPRRLTEGEIESLRRAVGARRRVISHWRDSGLLP